MGIQSVVEQTDRISSGGHQDATCSVCEMAVVWMQNQLKQNQTEERIINYADSVLYIQICYLSSEILLPLLTIAL